LRTSRACCLIHANRVEAVQNEGPQTIACAFQILGEVAMRGIMAEPHVSQSIQALGKSAVPSPIA
jgi:hypothetical protein